jgi:hypothetical protein
MTKTKVIEAKGHSHGAARPKVRGVKWLDGDVSVFNVNPGVWQRAIIEAKKRGVPTTRIEIISATKVEFLCAH